MMMSESAENGSQHITIAGIVKRRTYIISIHFLFEVKTQKSGCQNSESLNTHNLKSYKAMVSDIDLRNPSLPIGSHIVKRWT